MWIACHDLNVGTRIAPKGGPVPEAYAWADTGPWVTYGHIRWDPDSVDPVAPPVSAVAEPELSPLPGPAAAEIPEPTPTVPAFQRRKKRG